MDILTWLLSLLIKSQALVAGANLLLGQEGSIMLSRMNFLSPDSLCYSFDQRANGYARGEGIVVMLMKRLSDAVKNGDTIRAVIRATGSNSDGHTPSMTVPSASSQESLIRSVYSKAGLDFAATRYIEAHGKWFTKLSVIGHLSIMPGTGTSVGDPIEISAIGRVFRPSHSKADPLYV